MKKGQLLSQPFFYIFAIIVIGLILIFGFKYVNQLLNAGCQVEVLDFGNDVKAKVNELVSLSSGSSFECKLVSFSGQSENSCEFVIPNNIRGVCFVDTTKIYNADQIQFKDVKDIVVGLGKNANRNLFFSLAKGSDCKAEPMKVNKLTTEGVVCVDLKNSFIMESAGREVVIKKA